MHMRLLVALTAVALMLGAAHAQGPANRPVRMDETGLLRWDETDDEVALFGVNYYPMFVFNYSDLKHLGVDIERVIDGDITHFVRMGLDALRLHVFDRSISDLDGNLLDNEPLRLLDYLLARAKDRGIYTVLTPIAWWPTGEAHPGFSSRWPMTEMTTNPEAWAVQCRYLGQFMSHINPYTGLAYQDDPCVPVIELINEPLYPAGIDDSRIATYIDTLAKAVRDTGCTKPIFYNGWGDHYAAVRDAAIQGCSFGWYPTGLVAGRSLAQNFLQRLDDYPAMRCDALESKAKIVYEFDAADVPGSYMYPAMARAFRSGGAQIATQFQYDPLPLAPHNLGWQTHYLCLVHAPAMTMSFIIANEAFHRLPRFETYGTYPESNRFGEFRVCYEEDLSEWVTPTAFLYSNTTATPPPVPDRLERIAGYGSSPVVRYPGTGAYFLDRLAPGHWRIEVYPDAVWVGDPYGQPSFDRLVSRLLWRTWPVEIDLPDLGHAFTVEPLDAGNVHCPEVVDGAFPVRPGVYHLRRIDALEVELPATVGRLGLREFVVPPKGEGLPAPDVRHDAFSTWPEGKSVPIRVTVAYERTPESVILYVQEPDRGTAFRPLAMAPASPYIYEASVPADLVRPDAVAYYIQVAAGDRTWRYPAEVPAVAEHLLFAVDSMFAAPEVDYHGPADDHATAERVDGEDGQQALRVTATGFDPEAHGSVVHLQVPAGPADTGALVDGTLVVRARALYGQTACFELGLVQDTDHAYGVDVVLTRGWRDFRIPLKDLRPLWETPGGRCQPDRIRELSVILGTWLFGRDAALPHGIEIERITVEPAPGLWEVPVSASDAPPVLLDPDRHQLSIWGRHYSRRLVPGMTGDAVALRMDVEAFEPAPDALSFRCVATEEVQLRRDYLAQCDTVVLRARACEAATNAVELVLIERDGSPWGTTVSLTTEWRDIQLPIKDLQHFAHWNEGPAARGHAGDCFHSAEASGVNLCFGAWLYPDTFAQPHGIEVETVLLDSILKRG
ncbi:MAG TPA: hypothetical protein PK468_20680, partial [Candidatus Hydrogenedentes bacterium]|nr:hypothetical protein [Candidatus Hydrogenedentota bacterium]